MGHLVKTSADTLVSYLFTLDGAVVPKARPRHNGRNCYLPSRYRDWKESAIAQLHSQRSFSAPIERASVSIEIHGCRRGDADNLAGAVLDALTQAEVIRDDRLSCVPELIVRYIGGKKKQALVIVSDMGQLT